MTALPLPSHEVQLLHRTPRWQSIDPTFQPESKGYLTSALLMPTVATGISLLLLAGLHLLIARCRYLSRHHGVGVEKLERRMITALYLAFTLAAVIALHLLFYGSSMASDAATSACGDVDYFDQTMTTIITTSKALPWQLHQAVGNLSQAREAASKRSCNVTISVPSLRQVESLESVAKSVGPLAVSMVQSAQPLILTARKELNLYGIYYSKIFCYVTYSVIMVGLVSLTFSIYHQKLTMLMVSALITQAISFLLIMAGSFVLYVLQLSADFCIDPTKSILSLLPSTAHSIMQLFSNCASIPISPSLLPIIQLLMAFSKAVQSSIPPRVSNTCEHIARKLNTSSALINSSVMNLQETSAALSCAQISSVYST